MFLELATVLMLVPDSNPVVQELAYTAKYLQPAIGLDLSQALARTLYYNGAMNHEDPFVSLAIAFQESGLNPDAMSETGDIGLFQFSPQAINDSNLDRRRLLTDLQYQVLQHFVLLTEKQSICHGRHSWACWHSATPDLRFQYAKKVLKFFRPLPICTIDHQQVLCRKRKHREISAAP